MPIITIASIEAKSDKLSLITTTDGKKFGAWKETKHIFTAGGTYDVELREKELNGTTYVNVSKAKLVTSPAVAPASVAAANPQASELEAERAFVTSTLTALIRAGEVPCNKDALWAATNLLRTLWRHTFGASGQLHATISQRAMIERDINRDTPPSRAYKASNGPVDEMPAWLTEGPAPGMQAAE